MTSLSSLPRRRGLWMSASSFSAMCGKTAGRRGMCWVYFRRNNRLFSSPKASSEVSAISAHGDQGGATTTVVIQGRTTTGSSFQHHGLWDGVAGEKRKIFVRCISSFGRGDGFSGGGGAGRGWGTSDGSPSRPPPEQKPAEETEEDAIDPITLRRIIRDKQAVEGDWGMRREPKEEEIKSNPEPPSSTEPPGVKDVYSFMSDFLSPEYEARSWKEKEQEKLFKRLRKEFEELEERVARERTKRLKKEEEGREYLEKKLRKEEEERAERERKETKEREKELERERERRKEEYKKDKVVEGTEGSLGMPEIKSIPQPVPVLPPYTKFPPPEKPIEIDSKHVDPNQIAYKEQRAQPKFPQVTQFAPEAPVLVGDSNATPGTSGSGGSTSSGVEPLQDGGLTVKQAEESPKSVVTDILPEVPVMPNLVAEEAKKAVDENTHQDEQVGDVPILVENASTSDVDKGLLPVEEVGKEVPSPEPPITSTVGIEPKPAAATPPPPQLVPSHEASPTSSSIAPPEGVPIEAIPPPLRAEISHINKTLSEVTNIVNKLDSTMNHELNDIIIQLRVWRKGVEKLTSASGIAAKKLFIEDTKTISAEKSANDPPGPVEYKILTISPAPPHHILTTDLSVACGKGPGTTGKGIEEFLPNLKSPYLFLQHAPTLLREGWQLVSGSEEMLVFSRTPQAVPVPASDAGAADTTAVTTPQDNLNSLDSGRPIYEPETDFEAKSTGYDVAGSGGNFKPGKRIRSYYDDGRHLHLQGHGLGGIAGDSISFAQGVNPIDMTTRESDDELVRAAEEEEKERLIEWNSKRIDAVKSMQEALQAKAGQEDTAAAMDDTKKVEEAGFEASKGHVKEEAEGPMRPYKEALKESGVFNDGPGKAYEEAVEEGEKQDIERAEKAKGSRVGKFFKRLGWTLVLVGGGMVAIKEVGYWSEKPVEKTMELGSAGNSNSAMVGPIGRLENQSPAFGDRSAIEAAPVVSRWESGEVVRPGRRYSWSEREKFFREGGDRQFVGRAWGDQAR